MPTNPATRSRLAIAPPDRQLTLLATPPSFRITKNAQARNAYGTVAAELVCATLDLLPIRINDNYEVCFDAMRDPDYYEIKSVHRNGKVVIYDWRMAKEASANVPLYYAILVHRVRGSDGSDIASEMAAGGLQLLTLPAPIVHEIARQQPLRRLQKPSPDPHNGYSRKGYADGYRNVPLHALLNLTTRQTSLTFTYCNQPI